MVSFVANGAIFYFSQGGTCQILITIWKVSRNWASIFSRPLIRGWRNILIHNLYNPAWSQLLVILRPLPTSHLMSETQRTYYLEKLDQVQQYVKILSNLFCIWGYPDKKYSWMVLGYRNPYTDECPCDNEIGRLATVLSKWLYKEDGDWAAQAKSQARNLSRENGSFY